MPIWGQVELLCRAVAEEARREEERILSEAGSEAERVVAEARERAEKHYAEEMLSQRSKVHAEARRVTDSAELQARRGLMAFRERIVREVFDALRERLKKLRSEPAYADSVMSGLREGIGRLPGKDFVAELNERDEVLFKDRIEQLAVELSIRIETRPSPSLEGGVRVTTGDMRLLYDNSFSARLRRNEHAIRQEIWREIFGTEGRQD